MTPEQMQSLLDKAMFYSTDAVWTQMDDAQLEANGYKAYSCSIFENEKLLHRYLVVAQLKDRTTARGTYTGVTDNVVMNLPPENAWTLFEEATKSRKKKKPT